MTFEEWVRAEYNEVAAEFMLEKAAKEESRLGIYRAWNASRKSAFLEAAMILEKKSHSSYLSMSKLIAELVSKAEEVE